MTVASMTTETMATRVATRRHAEVPCAGNVLELVGKTPLLRLSRYLDNAGVELLVKLESQNPGGSAKDRPALRMLQHALDCGDIDEKTTVVESSSGNMGIGLAQACRYYQLPFICIVDPHAQQQNVSIMEALGATVDRVSSKVHGSFLAARLQRVRHHLQTIPNSFWPNQYANRQNPAAHEFGTIREIDEATSGDVDFLFVATSSTGTAQGCRDYLRRRGRATQVVAVDAQGSVLFGGTPGERQIPGLGAGQVPALARDQVFDHVRRVADLDCVIGCRRAALREALLIGGSAGGVLEVVRSMQHELVGKRSVAILHDSGTRYLNTVFDDRWVQGALGVDSQQLKDMLSRPALVSMPE